MGKGGDLSLCVGIRGWRETPVLQICGRIAAVMFAHFAVRRNIIHAVNITDEVNITCPQGQTSLKKDQLTSELVFFLAYPIGFEPTTFRVGV